VTEMVASAELGVPHEEEWRGGFLGILGSWKAVAWASSRRTVAAWAQCGRWGSATCGARRPMASGGWWVRPVCERRVAWPWDPQASCTGALRRGSQTNRHWPASAFVYGEYDGGPTSRARRRAHAESWRVPVQKGFNIALLTTIFLKIL
jgi:hypothetical protein